MRITRGIAKNTRKNAKNFIHKQAQKRLDEAVEPFNKQVTNSLQVNAVDVELYNINMTGKPCTCCKIQHDPRVDAVIPTIPTPEQNNSQGVTIKHKNTLFGGNRAEKMYNTSSTTIDVSGNNMEIDYDIPNALLDLEEEDDGYVLEDSILSGSNVDCGICYRTGFQPGYTAYNKQQALFTTWDIEENKGYFIDKTAAPNAFVKQAEKEGYIAFVLTVPLQFKGCKYSIRNNNEILDDAPYLAKEMKYPGERITLALLKHYAGHSVIVKVKATKFTHIVFEFDFGMPVLKGNIGAETHVIDFTKYESLGSFPLVLPPSVHRINPMDMVFIPSRNIVLRVTDKEQKMTATKRRLEWMVNTRFVQKVETVRNLKRHHNVN